MKGEGFFIMLKIYSTCVHVVVKVLVFSKPACCTVQLVQTACVNQSDFITVINFSENNRPTQSSVNWL